MRIDKLELTNFRCYEKENFEFTEQFTVIIGENGKGKTTIADALTIAAGSFLLEIEEDQSRIIIQNEDIRKIDYGTDFRAQPPSIIRASGSIEEKNIHWARTLAKVNGNNSHETDQLGQIAGKYQEEFRNGKNPDFPVLAYFGTGRLWVKKIPKINSRANDSVLKDGYYACLEAKSVIFPYLQWMKSCERILNRKETELQKIANAELKIRTKDLYDAVKEAITNCIEGWTDLYFNEDDNEEKDDLVGFSIKKPGTHALELFAKPQYDQTGNVISRVPFRQLSDGQRAVVMMVAELAYRCVTLNGHHGKDAVRNSKGIVIIDEIDQHLHPKWQRRIVGDLKRTFPGIQFIATTHSPFIIQSLKKEELINLDETEELLKNPDEMPINRIITGLMDVKNIRSDNFDERVLAAEKELEKIGSGKKELTLDDYADISKKLGEFLEDETDDPEYKAFIRKQNEK